MWFTAKAVQVCVTYLQTEDHQTKVPLCRNLKIWVTPYVRLKELRHLIPLQRRRSRV